MKYGLIIAIYYIYCLAVIFATGYVVFVLDRSGWWFLLAIVLLEISPAIKTKD